ncbi:MAG: selenocysteine-specific translation elongation factor [Bryobacter sp.]|jgi:selenocysteine-specific elongation factor|nr:selenocysteine-specific translation elongation factor [Bryobacter sp. CoA8 C33]
MTHIIAGTAGHIDHGKTSLVKALTGIDTDRLKEEKQRGISIELGFANLTAPAGVKLAFVDVPGHERFVRNMLAGVSGIDVVLFVIAADELIKPQTREHFEICRLLGLKRGVIALTKADLVDEEWLELARLEVEEFVRGSFLETAPVIAVSTVNGAGMPDLLAALVEAAREYKAPAAAGWPRLPVDRAFVIKGHGTVVTGTLRGGAIALEDELELYPLGRKVRVRGLEVHGTAVKQARPGQRVALNLTGVEAGEIERGQVVSLPARPRASRLLDCEIELLPEARAIRDRARVHFHSGSAEEVAEVRVLEDSRRIEPGATAMARLVLERPLLVLPGDRFILRSFSPVSTVGGGTVLDLNTTGQRMRRKGAAERLRRWRGMQTTERVAALAGEEPLGAALAEIEARLGQDLKTLPEGIERSGNWLIARQELKQLAAAVVDRLRRHHQDKPLETGLSREMLRSQLLGSAPAGVLDLVLKQAPAVKSEGEWLRLESHQVRLAGAEDEAAKRIEKAFADAGLAVPALGEVLGSCGIDANRARTVLAILLREGKLVRVGPELVYHARAISELKELLRTRRGTRFGVVEFKEWTGVSRKYAIPLLEYLDREKMTRREGEGRQIL